MSSSAERAVQGKEENHLDNISEYENEQRIPIEDEKPINDVTTTYNSDAKSDINVNASVDDSVVNGLSISTTIDDVTIASGKLEYDTKTDEHFKSTTKADDDFSLHQQHNKNTSAIPCPDNAISIGQNIENCTKDSNKTDTTSTHILLASQSPPTHRIDETTSIDDVDYRTRPLEQQKRNKKLHNIKETHPFKYRDGIKHDIVFSTPRLVRKSSNTSLIPRRVSFPKSDHELVTGYLEPANPWESAYVVKSSKEIVDLYTGSCRRHNTKPLPAILEHLRTIVLSDKRQPLLNLKGVKLRPSDCEALEEVFKRVQYQTIDLSACDLEESAASALFEMMEYYEAATELDISSNSSAMTHRGWTSCTYLISHSEALQVLNAQGNPISKLSAESLGHALNTSNLHTLKLEHCGLKGAPLNGLCFKLRQNHVLKELWVAYNDLDYRDADHLADLLKVNHCLELLDISNNKINDAGLRVIVRALITQSNELRQSSLFKPSNDNVGTLEGADCLRHDKSDIFYTIESNQNDSNSHTNISDNINCSKYSIEKCEDTREIETDSDMNKIQNIFTSSIDRGESCSDNTIQNAINAKHLKSSTQNTCHSMLDKLLSLNCSDDDCSPDIVIEPNADHCCPVGVANSCSVSDSAVNVPPVVVTVNADVVQDSAQDDHAPNEFKDLMSFDSLDYEDNRRSEPVPASTEKYDLENDELDQRCTENALTRSKGSLESASVLLRATNEERSCHHSFEIKDILHKDSLQTLDASKAHDATKLAKYGEECDDTRSTDSAFESASEGDISRFFPEEILDVYNKKIPIETATIATECPSPGKAFSAPSLKVLSSPSEQQIMRDFLDTSRSNDSGSESFERKNLRDKLDILKREHPTDRRSLVNHKRSQSSDIMNPIVNLPETETIFITQSNRIHSQSSDSLCSDNSLDCSSSSEINFSSVAPINEKLTKNDTLTRQQRQQTTHTHNVHKPPAGLKALAVWNNNLTKDSGLYIADLLAETVTLELLNIGKNCLSNEFIARLKESLTKNTTLETLGLQSAHLSKLGIELLSSIMTFGGNTSLKRIDIRDNKIDVEGLTTLAEMLNSNTTVTQIDIDDEPKRLSVGSEEHLDYARVLENVRSRCSRNEMKRIQYKGKCSLEPEPRKDHWTKRKISLTCQARPVLDKSLLTSSSATVGGANKMDFKRKAGVRLRSPLPSPPIISPSSSPNRSRFQVHRVEEIDIETPPTSPVLGTNPAPTTTSIKVTARASYKANISNSLPTSSSLPSMTTAISTIPPSRRLTGSLGSRFQVSKIYEDPTVPLSSRSMPPITTTPTSTPTSTPTTPSTPLITTTSEDDCPQSDTAENNLNQCNILHNNNTANKAIHKPLIAPDAAEVTGDWISCRPASPIAPNYVPTQNALSTTSIGSVWASLKRCPIAVFSDNDISINRNDCLSSSGSDETVADTAPTLLAATNVGSASAGSTDDNEDGALVRQSPEHSRKSSWIVNSDNVDKLLSIFQHPSNFFQPNTRLKPKPTIKTDAIQALNPADGVLDGLPSLHSDHHNQNCLVANEKFTLPNWSKLGAHMQTLNGTEGGNSAARDAAVATLEQSKTFIQVATRQIRDKSKEMFPQNFYFGNLRGVAGPIDNATEDAATTPDTDENSEHRLCNSVEPMAELLPTETSEPVVVDSAETTTETTPETTAAATTETTTTETPPPPQINCTFNEENQTMGICEDQNS